MNKAFVRENDAVAEYCPRCGAAGESVGADTLDAFLPGEKRRMVATPANFCPSPGCRVVYFDGFERVVLVEDLDRSVYPKDPDAPLCGCFGLTRADIEQDIAEGVVTRTKAVVQKAASSEARCATMAVNGRPCTAWVQKCYFQLKASQESE